MFLVAEVLEVRLHSGAAADQRRVLETAPHALARIRSP